MLVEQFGAFSSDIHTIKPEVITEQTLQIPKTRDRLLTRVAARSSVKRGKSCGLQVLG